MTKGADIKVLIRALYEIRGEHDLSHSQRAAVAWVIGILMAYVEHPDD